MDENKLPEQNSPAASPGTQHHSSRLPLIIIGIVMLVIGIGVGYAIATITHPSPTANTLSNAQPSQAANQTVSPTDSNQIDTWREYESKKLPTISFSAYAISYPPTWTRDIERNEKTEFDSFRLTKNNHIITIQQGAMDGNVCLFEGKLTEGPVNDYRDTPYVQIDAPIGTLRRIPLETQNQNELNYGFCISNERNKPDFGKPTQVGVVSYTIPKKYDPEILSEMDKIVATLKESQ